MSRFTNGGDRDDQGRFQVGNPGGPEGLTSRDLERLAELVVAELVEDAPEEAEEAAVTRTLRTQESRPRKARGSDRFTVCISPRLRVEMADFQAEHAVNWSHWVRIALRARMRSKCDDELADAP